MKSDEQKLAQAAPTYHVPVLLNESVDGLDIPPDSVYVDVTFGGGGHSREILQRLGPSGRLYGFDQDSDACRNIMDDDRFIFVHSNFRYLRNWMRYHGEEHIDGLLADLGVSSHHFDDAARGFSFRFDAPLDMRMNRQATLTAEQVVNEYSEEQLADVLYLYGELRQARHLAAAIVKARQKQPIHTTGQLLAALGIDICAENAPQNSQWKKDAAKLFQALRIEVNHELEALREMLNAACQLLKPDGRLSIITYHSLEDRIVKNMMRAGNAEGKTEHDFFGRTQAPLHIINNKAITPSDEEVERNPRSRSAKLRVAAKI